MKFVSWNCNGAFRNKFQHLERFDADVIIIQECEDPGQSSEDYRQWAGDYLWTGEKHKGLGIFARNGTILNGISHNAENTVDEPKFFLQCKINNQITLFGIWTKRDSELNRSYTDQLKIFTGAHKECLDDENVILCGDLNSNVIWDKKSHSYNHADFIKGLGAKSIVSLYHQQENETQGSESQKTFYMHRNLEKGYHIDYVFLSDHLLPSSKLTISDPNSWLAHSDHMPVVFEVG